MESGTVLLVEDNPQDIELTLRGLRRRKFANPIRVLRDGEEALDYIHGRGQFAASAPVPVLILLDLRLPKIDGVEVLRQARAHPTYQTVPVVVLTSSPEDTDVWRCSDLGVTSYIVKPVDFEQLLGVVDRLDLAWIVTSDPPLAA